MFEDICNKEIPLSVWSNNCLDLGISINIYHLGLTQNSKYLTSSYFGSIPSTAHRTPSVIEYKMEWTIDAPLLNLLRTAETGQCFVSPIYENMWHIECEVVDGGDCDDVGFTLVTIPSNPPPACRVSAIYYQETIKCHEIVTFKTIRNDDSEFVYSFFDDDDDGSEDEGDDPMFSKSDIAELESVTFEFNFKITGGEQWQSNSDVTDPEHIAHILSSDQKQNFSSEMQQQRETLSDFMETVRTEMANISSQLNDLRNVVMEEQKNEEINGLDAVNERIDSLEMNLNRFMKEREQRKDQESSELAAVRRWMNTVVKLPQYMDMFIENGFEDLSVIQDLTIDDLMEMGIEKK